MASQRVPLTPSFTASTSNIQTDSLDCGIKAIGWCSGEKWQRLARLRLFLPVFLLTGIVQGASETYYRISTKQTTSFHDYDPKVIDWLLVVNNIFQALLAFIVGFWSQRFHPMGWLGGSVIFQSIFYFFSVIPTLTHYDFDITSIKYDNFSSICKTSTMNLGLEEERPDSTTKLIMLFIIQFGIALGFAAFYIIGFPYIDDNANSEDTPIILGAALAVHVWGSVLGSSLTFIADVKYLNWWFGWITLGPILLLLGILLSMFPRKLLKKVLQQAAQRIINGASASPVRSRQFQFLDDMRFLPSLQRLLTNKILMFNLCSLIAIETGISHYVLNEQNYLQSRFYFPTDENNGIMDEWMSRLLTYLLKPPIIGTCMLVTGLIISKLKPSARFLPMWNIISSVLIVLVFISFIFIDCSNSITIAGIRKGVLTQPYCSRECICSSTDLHFMPVCSEKSNLTFYSPCHAGCKNEININGLTLYENCSCGSDIEHYVESSRRATQGACNAKDCQAKWITFQVLLVFTTALYGTILVCKVMITLRCVLPQDKSLALSLEFFLSGLIVYIPGKIVYDFITNNTCAFWAFNFKKCLLQNSPLYGDLLNYTTIVLMIISIILDVFVYVSVNELELFPKETDFDEEHYRFTPPLLSAPPPPQAQLQNDTTGTTVNSGNNNNTNNNNNDSDVRDAPSHPSPEEIIPFLQAQSRQYHPIISSTSSEDEPSPKISSFRGQGAIPKVLVHRQPRTIETTF